MPIWARMVIAWLVVGTVANVIATIAVPDAYSFWRGELLSLVGIAGVVGCVAMILWALGDL